MATMNDLVSDIDPTTLAAENDLIEGRQQTSSRKWMSIDEAKLKASLSSTAKEHNTDIITPKRLGETLFNIYETRKVFEEKVKNEKQFCKLVALLPLSLLDETYGNATFIENVFSPLLESNSLNSCETFLTQLHRFLKPVSCKRFKSSKLRFPGMADRKLSITIHSSEPSSESSPPAWPFDKEATWSTFSQTHVVHGNKFKDCLMQSAAVVNLIFAEYASATGPDFQITTTSIGSVPHDINKTSTSPALVVHLTKPILVRVEQRAIGGDNKNDYRFVIEVDAMEILKRFEESLPEFDWRTTKIVLPMSKASKTMFFCSDKKITKFSIDKDDQKTKDFWIKIRTLMFFERVVDDRGSFFQVKSYPESFDEELVCIVTKNEDSDDSRPIE